MFATDMILTHNVTVTDDTIAVCVLVLGDDSLAYFQIRVWQSSADAASMAERGQRFIHQPSDYFYLVRSFLRR